MLKWVPQQQQQHQQQPQSLQHEQLFPPQQTTTALVTVAANLKRLGGSDPRVATCRGKLQNKRSKLNQEINKELRLRAGAENLFKATTNRKLRETVALELSFVNSNLQLLKEQLAELNSSVELYQNDSLEPVMPMIPLGLKETKEIDFREPFKDFILEHYSEDGETYEEAIAELMDIRQAMRTPLRDGSGVALLFQYYNQLYFVERRFFPPDRSLGIYFEWYDSLTGVPSCQRTVAFERACVLFNAAAVYTQIGARQDRGRPRGLDRAADAFLRAAGLFNYIRDNFTNAPSMDLGPDMLDMLLTLMLAQARECLVEKLSLQEMGQQEVSVIAQLHLEIAQECARLRHDYAALVELVNSPAVKPYVPYSWVALVCVKVQHYSALAHFRAGQGLTILAEEAEEALAEATQSSSSNGTKLSTQTTTTTGGGGGLKNTSKSLMADGKTTTKAPAPPPPTTTGSNNSSVSSSNKNGLRNYTSQAIKHATSLGSLNNALGGGIGKDKSSNGNGKLNGKMSRKMMPAPIAPKPTSGSLSSTTSLATTASSSGGICHQMIATLYCDEDAINESQFKDIGRAHLKEALLSHEEAQRLHRMSRELRGKTALASVLKRCHAQALDAYAATETEDDFQELINPPIVAPSTKFQLTLTSPDFSRHRVEDLFRGLGPVAIFSAKHHWTAPRTVTLRSPHQHNNLLHLSTNNLTSDNSAVNNNNAGLGFSVRGDGPVVVAAVESGSLADLGGVKEGDLIVSIGTRDVKWSTHEEVVTLIRQAGASLTMRLVTPMDNTYGKPAAKCVVAKGSVSGGSSHSSSGVSSGEPSPAGSLSHHKRLTWNPFRRSGTSNNSSTSSTNTTHNSTNVILR